jgi:diaminopimelate epimerase
LLGLSDRQATVNLPGGPLQISWEKPGASVFMTGPAVAVFDGVLNPELVPSEAVGTESPSTVISEQIPPASTTSPSEPTASQSASSETGDDCSEEEAQARVQAFLASTSLDSMINIATESLEERTQSRFQRDVQP